MIFSTVVALIAVLILGYSLGRGEASNASQNQAMFTSAKEDNQALLESLDKVKHERLALSKKVTPTPLQDMPPKQEEKPKLQIQISDPAPKAAPTPVKAIAKKTGLEILDEKLHESHAFPKPVRLPQPPIQLASGEKPKLAIIIDDISSSAQLGYIRSTGLKLTPSIFPPYQGVPASNKLAAGLSHYMVHLPMESGKIYDRQAKTLKTTDTKEQMEARLKEIRALFPTARFINNHTGSVFTANEAAMERIYPLFKEEGFMFIDSRTIGRTAAPQMAKKYAQRYLARDVFIDNIQNVSSIHMQLRQAVLVAKKRGYAIAIGHPHKTTMAALKSAGGILNDVDVVYIDELVESIKKR